mmetsp:Transcript_11202/g.30566  ORF Transcript_11202/g.30566 Transcript_11202/m.30566 type:complete len:202 (-) Transcript_11202:260-865(-)
MDYVPRSPHTDVCLYAYLASNSAHPSTPPRCTWTPSPRPLCMCRQPGRLCRPRSDELVEYDQSTAGGCVRYGRTLDTHLNTAWEEMTTLGSTQSCDGEVWSFRRTGWWKVVNWESTSCPVSRALPSTHLPRCTGSPHPGPPSVHRPPCRHCRCHQSSCLAYDQTAVVDHPPRRMSQDSQLEATRKETRLRVLWVFGSTWAS